MAMGIAGFFVSDEGRKLGEMKMREATLKFVIFPRPEIYAGPLAILVDSGSASTTEILSQGLQDLGRARIFGTRHRRRGVAFGYRSVAKRRRISVRRGELYVREGEGAGGAGVTPDVEVRQTREALAAGRDSVVDAAAEWIGSPKK